MMSQLGAMGGGQANSEPVPVMGSMMKMRMMGFRVLPLLKLFKIFEEAGKADGRRYLWRK
jgi:hypothetical protein